MKKNHANNNSEVMQKILAKLLSKHNITHISVHNPRDALSYLSNPHNPRPNIIFLKVNQTPTNRTEPSY